MSELLKFPTNRRMIGTLMGLGWTPEQGSRSQSTFVMKAFAIFELNGRVEAYEIQNPGDYFYLMSLLNSYGTRFNYSLKQEEVFARHDLQVESGNGANIGLYEYMGGQWHHIPRSIGHFVDSTKPEAIASVANSNIIPFPTT